MNDKERVAAAMENESVMSAIETLIKEKVVYWLSVIIHKLRKSSITCITWVVEKSHKKVSNLVKEEKAPILIWNCHIVVKVVVYKIYPHKTKIVEQIYWHSVPISRQIFDVLDTNFIWECIVTWERNIVKVRNCIVILLVTISGI